MSAQNIKKRKKRTPKQRLCTPRLNALIAAALSIPSVGASSTNAYAQSVDPETTIRFLYADYLDSQSGHETRMRVKSPMLWLKTPLGEQTEFESSFILDTMAGASPFYLSTLTGASGKGVEDVRHAADGKITRYFDRFSVGIGGVVSSEDDYLSRGGLLEVRLWTPDKNTTFTVGGSFHSDDITSSINTELRESRRTQDYLLGITQIIDPISILQSNLSFSSGDGYFADPYKPLDKRPHSRDQWAWLTRYVRYIAQAEASLHLDYRYFRDTWGVTSHMFDAAWYQPLGTVWVLRPNIRYYSQNKADFFQSVFPPDDLSGIIFSADQRLAAFGGITAGLKLSRDLGKGFSANLKFDYLTQRAGLKLGSDGSSNIKPFYARILSVGLAKSF